MIEELVDGLCWRGDWWERIVGGLLGLAVGDALGLPWEFVSKEEVRQRFRGEMVGGGTWGMPAGTWSDDTGQALAMVDALHRGGRLEDFARALLDWYHGAYGEVFDVGLTTGEALARLARGVDPARSGVYRASCGSLMRTYPIAVYTLCMPLGEALSLVHSAGRITHSHELSVIATGLYTVVVRGLFAGLSPWDAVAAAGEALERFYDWAPRGAKELYSYLYSREALLEEPESGSCFAPATLRAALWSLLTSSSFREALVRAVSLGGDTDTVAAITGSLAGVVYGVQGIPREWLNTLRDRGLVEEKAGELAEVTRAVCEKQC